MNIKISPCKPQGKIIAPPSKSDAHRLLVCAGLANGESRIDNIALSNDIKATLGCLEAMGAQWSQTDTGIIIRGTDPTKAASGREIFCNECGTTIRFFIPLCLLSDTPCKVTGSERLLARPLTVYEEICNSQGIEFSNNGKAISLKGRLSAGEYVVKGNISSQFISGLLFALPLLEGDSTIKIIAPFESRPYVDMTLSVLKLAGIVINKADDLTFEIPGNQTYRPFNRTVEGDWSNAAFPYALKAMGNNIEIEGLKADSLQGDKCCVKHFDELKAGTPTIDLSDCPDLAPILFAFAGMHNGATFTGTARLKIKESDRIGEMAEELIKFGIRLTEGDNTVTVEGGNFHAPSDILYGHNDHRIVMTMAVLLTATGGTISGTEAVNKSYPDFFTELHKTGVILDYDT